MGNPFHHAGLRAGTVLVLGAAVYAGTLHAPYVFDDFGSIRDNATIRSLDPRIILSPPRENTVSARPVANASFALNVAIAGDSLAAFHAGNVLIHLLATLLLLGLARRTMRLTGMLDGRADDLATVIAVMWAVHPLATESVTYLVQRVESLAAMFILLTLYASMRAQTSSRRVEWSVVAIAASLLGMGSKETFAVAPLLVVLYDRAFVFDSLRAALRLRGLFYAALAATGAVLAALVAQDARHRSAGLHFQRFGPIDYARIQFGAVIHYIRLVFWPHPMVFDYGEPNDGVPLAARFAEWGPPAGLLLALFTTALLAWRWRPAVGFLGTAFFVLLAPSSTVIPVTTEVIAEHRVYLASAAVIALAVLAVDALLRSLLGPRSRAAIGGGLAALTIAALGILTVRRNEVYASNLRLWGDTVAHWPDNPRAWVALADARLLAGDEAGAEGAVTAALALSPTHATANVRAGEIADRKADCATAVRHFETALARLPDNVDLQVDTANCLMRLGRTEEAVGHYREALEYVPDRPDVLAGYAGALGKLGRFDEAITHLEQALRERPGWPDAWFNLGGVYVRMNRYRKALKSFERAASLKPDFALAHERSGVVAAWMNRMPEAEIQLGEAMRLNPSDPEAPEALAWALATRPAASAADAPRAVVLATNATRLAPHSAHAWDVRAAAEAAAGDFPSAVRDARHGLDDDAAAHGNDSTDIRRHLDQYERRLPWRAPLAPMPLAWPE